MIVYGIPTCATVKKALAALKAAGHDPAFRDVRRQPLTADERAELLAAFGDGLVNRASATWRGLPEADRAAEPDALLAAQGWNPLDTNSVRFEVPLPDLISAPIAQPTAMAMAGHLLWMERAAPDDFTVCTTAASATAADPASVWRMEPGLLLAAQ